MRVKTKGVCDWQEVMELSVETILYVNIILYGALKTSKMFDNSAHHIVHVLFRTN